MPEPEQKIYICRVHGGQYEAPYWQADEICDECYEKEAADIN